MALAPLEPPLGRKAVQGPGQGAIAVTRGTLIYRLTWPLVLAACSAGCQTTAWPDLAHPGSVQAQQARAIRYDPYPELDLGPISEGTRPPDYDKPLPELQRGRWYLGDWQCGR